LKAEGRYEWRLWENKLHFDNPQIWKATAGLWCYMESLKKERGFLCITILILKLFTHSIY